MHRLESISIDLVTRLRTASTAKQRAATLAACEFAVSRSGIRNATTDKAMSELRTTGTISPKTTAELQAIVEQLDDEAFHAQEASDVRQGSNEDYLAAFARARCGAAISLAGTADPLEAALEAIYEAAMTADEPEKIISVVQGAL